MPSPLQEPCHPHSHLRHLLCHPTSKCACYYSFTMLHMAMVSVSTDSHSSLITQRASLSPPPAPTPCYYTTRTVADIHACGCPRCVFPATSTQIAHVSTSTTSADSQPADNVSTLSQTAGRPLHRLQAQSAPSSAHAAPNGVEESQEAKATAPTAAGPDAALQMCEAMTDTARVEETPLLWCSVTEAHTVAGIHDTACCNAVEVGDVTTAADKHTVKGGAEPQPNSMSKPPAARLRLRARRMPWFHREAGHQSEQVSCTYTCAHIRCSYSLRVWLCPIWCRSPADLCWSCTASWRCCDLARVPSL